MRAIAVLLLVLSAACRGNEGAVSELPPEPAPQRPNIILISIDALGAKHLGCYGSDRPTSPFLDELARGGTRYSLAFANTHGTTPSHTTMLSGQYQETHRVGWEKAEDSSLEVVTPIPRGVPLIAPILRRNGYVTLGVTDGGNIGRKFGFDRGFDVFDDEGSGVRRVVERMLGLVEEHKAQGRPLFLLLHTYEVHSPYEAPKEYTDLFPSKGSSFVPSSKNLLEHVHDAWSTLSPADFALIRNAYHAELRLTDDTLRHFFERLRALGVLDDAIIVVTGDHGEEIGEHGGLLHRDFLYEELIHVPLIVAGRGVAAGAVDDGPVGLVDIAPSLISAAGFKPPKRMEGRVAFPRKTPQGEARVFSQYAHSRYSVRTPRWKLIESTSPQKMELYDLESDPGERTNLVRENPDVARALHAELEQWRTTRTPVDGAPAPVALTPEEIERLKALGYLGGN